MHLRFKKYLILALGNLAILVFFVLSVEGLLALSYVFSPYLKFSIKAVQEYYMKYDRYIVQYMSECAQFDSKLSYRFKPNNKCLFKNREFAIEVKTNSAGVRDDQVSLESPKVIFTGDSHAMGWGVDNDKIVSSLIEKALSVSVLNVSVSSYGTAREALLIKDLKLKSPPRVIVWQYCPNDYTENLSFETVGGKFVPTIDRNQYKELSSNFGRQNPNIFSPFMRRFWPLVYRHFNDAVTTPPIVKKDRNRREAELFLNVLLNVDLSLTDTAVIVYESNARNQNDSYFVEELDRLVLDKNDQLKKKGIKILTVDISKVLTAKHFYFFDDHPNALGHRAIAELLLPQVKELLR